MGNSYLWETLIQRQRWRVSSYRLLIIRSRTTHIPHRTLQTASDYSSHAQPNEPHVPVTLHGRASFLWRCGGVYVGTLPSLRRDPRKQWPASNSADWWRLRARVAGRSATSCVTRVTGKEAMTVWKMCNGLRVFKSFLSLTALPLFSVVAILYSY